MREYKGFWDYLNNDPIVDDTFWFMMKVLGIIVGFLLLMAILT